VNPASVNPNADPDGGFAMARLINIESKFRDLSDDEWSWLYWFLGSGTGAVMKEGRNPEHRELVMRRSVELMNKLGALRDVLEGGRR
jgi:hypothetical protein